MVRQQDPPPTREPERVVEPPKPVTKPPEKEIDENAVKPSPEKKQTPQVKVNLTEVDRSKVKPKPEKSAAEIAREKARAEAAERAESERILAAARDAARGVRSGASKSTEIDMPGYGGGGVPYANFLQAVKSLYANAWTVPDGVTDDEATATASITILKDGTVREARITRSSGNDRVDQSVETVLNRIRFAVPLPDGAKENQRTVTIKFNVKAKLLG